MKALHFAACLLITACVNQTRTPSGADSADMRPAVITGHVANRDMYPATKEITLSMPFFDRVSRKQVSQIWEDGSFSFHMLPYMMRDVSLAPFVDRLLVSPGDSIHIEIDFADFNNVRFSGRGASDNEKLHAFHMRYYLNRWPSFSESRDGQRVYGSAKEYKEALGEQRREYLLRLEDFIAEEQPSEELVAFCRQEIEADYNSRLADQLLLYNDADGEDVSKMFDIADVEPLFEGESFNSRLCSLTESLTSWIAQSMSDERRVQISRSLPDCIAVLDDATDNELLSQMLKAQLFSALLEANAVDEFEKHLTLFNENVTFPLLKLSLRDKYLERKAYRDNPRLLSDAILKGDRRKDGVIGLGEENAGLKLLRDIISKSDGSVLFISIGANWCPGTRQEAPYLKSLALDFSGKPLRIANFFIDRGTDSVDPVTGIEDYYLTDEQLFGLDPIFHTGRGIPFYLLMDKNGIMVDYGEHLRPSLDATRERIQELTLDSSPVKMLRP